MRKNEKDWEGFMKNEKWLKRTKTWERMRWFKEDRNDIAKEWRFDCLRLRNNVRANDKDC